MTLERAVRRLRVTAAPRQHEWRVLVSRALMRWSACIEREPLRVYGFGAAIAFACGVLLGLL